MYKGYEGLQNRMIGRQPEQNDWKRPADVANKMAEMSLSPATADSGQASLNVTASAIEHDEETSIKSAALLSELNNAPPLSREISLFDDVNDYDRRQGPPTSSLGVWTRQTGPNSSYVPNVGIYQDVSVDPASTGNLNYRTHPVRNGLTAQNPSHRDPHNTAVPREANRQEHHNSLVMNIPPSLQEQRIKNTEILIGNAEQQPSFHTLPTVVSDLSPISRNAETQYDTYPSQVLQSLKPPSFGTLSPLGQPMFSLGAACNSSEDNFHMSMSPNTGPHGMMAQAGERQGPPWHNNFNGISYMGNSTTPGDCGRQISHSSSASSLRSFISDNCLVKKLSWKILRHVALTLQCKHSSASWKDLVERYGWDYERTYLFENKPHQEGIFFSLLLEPEFQDYSLEQLREDLFELPRRDILSDLNRMILEHNASASGGTTRQNQFP